jgi:hypothetical protein
LKIRNAKLIQNSHQTIFQENKKQSPTKPLSYYAKKDKHRAASMAYAYLIGHYTLVEMGNCFGVSYATVSRAVKAIECKM